MTIFSNVLTEYISVVVYAVKILNSVILQNHLPGKSPTFSSVTPASHLKIRVIAEKMYYGIQLVSCRHTYQGVSHT